MVLKGRLLIGIIGLVLICSPLATSYASIQVDDRPRFFAAYADGIAMTPTSSTPLQLHQSIEISFIVNPVVDTINNYGYVGEITVRLWWKHENMGAYIAEPDQITMSYETTTSLLPPNIFSIGPMDGDAGSYPNNLGAGQIYWYGELEVAFDKFDYYGSPQSPLTNVYYVGGVTTTQAPIQPPEEPADPFQGILEGILGEEFVSGLSAGFSSIGGNPVLILLIVAIGGIIAFLIITGRQNKSKQRGAPTRRKTKRKSTKQKKSSIRSFTRRFSSR